MSLLVRWTRGPLIVWLALALPACAAKRDLSPPPPDPVIVERETYKIGVTDLLRIDIWRNEALSVQVPVRMDGKISVPLLDDVQAEGLEPMELKEVLTREWSEYVDSPTVTVIVLGMNSQAVTVMGAIGRNSNIPLKRDLRVLEAIAKAGGFGNFADKSDVRIVRRNLDGSESEYRFDYDAYVSGQAPGTNIVLHNGDMIIVTE